MMGARVAVHEQALSLAERLRKECDVSSATPLEPARELPLFFPVACIIVAPLTVLSLYEWLSERGSFEASTLRICRDRRLRGAVVAHRGRGFLFADAADSPHEQRFTWAHEAAHYLGDHAYPRRDAIARHGENIAEIIDGKRAPTQNEQIDATLLGTSLEQYVHLMAHEDEASKSPRKAVALQESEARADAFACEILAPFALLKSRFPAVAANTEGAMQVQSTLVTEFGIPLKHALLHARAFVAQYGRRGSLLESL